MNRLSRVPVLLLFAAVPLAAQTETPRDTSYTIYSTWMKLREEYPHITPVEFRGQDGVRVDENIIYASYGNRRLHLDIFRPDDDVVHPVVLMIHGGGWRSGNKEMEHAMAGYFAMRGFAAVPVEYRLSTEAQYPAAVHDLKAAIRWLRVNASAQNIDPAKIFLYGNSAGGTLAALLGTTGDVLEFDGEGSNPGVPTSVQAIVDVDGILDFTHPAESGKDTGSAQPSAGALFFGATYREKPELWREASPLNHVSHNTPPVLFLNSSVARFHAGRDEMIERLNGFGIYSEVHTIPGTPHSFWMFHPWFEETAERAVSFLNAILKK
ncbi:MAG: alpha/beta hydrolase [Bacteroidetes bacterium]|nr:alpha/beta hydrolase [Bacteroidota bacterium]MCW5896919.1 alpha/beta hydrolase [Bacteroidota bacterium]